MSIWMTKFTWRTCKRHEADVIRDHFFEQWIQEYQEQEQDEAERKRYEHARDAADRVASNFADRHFGRMG
jgi:hypothetical protein